MSDYYGELQPHHDRARQVGWRDRYHQAVRFEAVLDAVGPVSSVVDLGCGLADLSRYVDARDVSWRYLGVELSADLAARAYKPERVVCADYLRDASSIAEAARARLGSVEWVTAVGAMVSGVDLRSDGTRRAHLAGLCRLAARLSRGGKGWVLSIIDQQALLRRPMLAAEGALGGATTHELEAVARLLGAEVSLTPLFGVELIAVFRHQQGGTTRSDPVRRWVTQALSHPWAIDAAPIDRAWLWYRAGDVETARSWLERADPSARARLLADALGR